MFKSVAAATAALAIAGSSIVYAQQRFEGPGKHGDGGPRFEHHHHLSVDDLKAFTDARIAALKAGLVLTPEQEKNWPAFEQALREMAQLRIQRIQAREAGNQQTQTPATPFDRLARRADRMAKRGAALKHIADTGAPLYQSLNDAQKDRFKLLARLLRPHHHRFAGNGGERGGWRHGGEGGWHGFGHRFGQEFGHHFGRGFGQDDSGPAGRVHRMMSGDDQESEL
jgi:hypothetical protein